MKKWLAILLVVVTTVFSLVMLNYARQEESRRFNNEYSEILSAASAFREIIYKDESDEASKFKSAGFISSPQLLVNYLESRGFLEKINENGSAVKGVRILQNGSYYFSDSVDGPRDVLLVIENEFNRPRGRTYNYAIDARGEVIYNFQGDVGGKQDAIFVNPAE